MPAGDQLAYFLAGHAAPAGAYRDVQTGRDIQMDEEGILPATCDGHVAVYIRQPATWAMTAQTSAAEPDSRARADPSVGHHGECPRRGSRCACQGPPAVHGRHGNRPLQPGHTA